MKTLPRLLLLLSLLAGGVPALTAASTPFRLFEIAVTRFSRADNGRATLELGLLGANGQLRAVESHDIAMPPGMPEAALGKFVVSSEAWFAFQSLGAQAVSNFERVNRGLPHVIAGLPHYEVEPSPAARLDVAGVVNLSSRGLITPGNTPALVSGFVIEGAAGSTRRVLIRAIGPSLAQFGIADAAPDPFIAIYQKNTFLNFNGNWGERYDADAIAEVSAQVGAFPLARTSKDAAMLVELPPGAYTANVFTEGNAAGGTALLEIYVLP
jgi:hypothetical protein